MTQQLTDTLGGITAEEASHLKKMNRILRNQISDRIRLTDLEHISLAEASKRPGRKALAQVA